MSDEASVYEALKNEQTSRINFRDGSLYLQLTSISTAAGIYLELGSVQILYAAMLSSMVFSCMYFLNDYYVSRLGRFFEQMPETFRAWEKYHRTGLGYAIQKLLRRAVVVFTFAVVPIVCAAALSAQSLNWTAIGVLLLAMAINAIGTLASRFA